MEVNLTETFKDIDQRKLGEDKMGIMDMGDGRIYQTGPDGEMKPIHPENFSLSIQDRKIAEYDKNKGLLSLDMSEGDLEKLIAMLGITPKGKDISLPLPPFGHQQYFEGVREMKSLYKEGPYTIKLVDGDGQNPSDNKSNSTPQTARYQDKPKGLFDRLRDYFK